ncbi:MAG: DM13 domain-containing protein [Pseudomonadota bacterium]
MNRRQFALGLLATSTASLLAPAAAFAAGKSGKFKSHKSYKVRGTAKVSTKGGKSVVTLSGFSTSPGPDLYVYVGQGSPTQRIAKLRANSGSQTYTLPASIKPGSISTVHIHCKRFSSTFGTARLR